MRRGAAVLTALVAALLLLQVAPLLPPAAPADAPAGCRETTARITGYVRTAPYFNAHTYDGTPILTPEPIVAASRDIPLQSTVTIDGLGTYRVADRGSGLHPTHVDIAVWSLDEAYAVTGERTICIREP